MSDLQAEVNYVECKISCYICSSMPPDVVVFPSSTEEVSLVAKVCTEMKAPMIPFGTGTGMEGGVICDQVWLFVCLSKSISPQAFMLLIPCLTHASEIRCVFLKSEHEVLESHRITIQLPSLREGRGMTLSILNISDSNIKIILLLLDHCGYLVGHAQYCPYIPVCLHGSERQQKKTK